MTNSRELLKAAQAGDKAAREALVEKNTGLVRSIAGRFTGRGYDHEDLFQIGVIGLLKSIDYFNLDYDVQFSTYAVPMIMGEIRRFLRDDGMIKVSRSIQDNRHQVNKVRESLRQQLNREPTLGEIASAAGISMEDLLTALNSAQEVESLHQTVYQGDGSSLLLLDKLAGNTGESGRIIDRVMLSETMAALSGRERELIVLRFYLDQTQSQIAKRMGVSQVQISRLEKKILKKMRTLMT